jgi:hypothetical protein
MWVMTNVILYATGEGEKPAASQPANKPGKKSPPRAGPAKPADGLE